MESSSFFSVGRHKKQLILSLKSGWVGSFIGKEWKKFISKISKFFPGTRKKINAASFKEEIRFEKEYICLPKFLEVPRVGSLRIFWWWEPSWLIVVHYALTSGDLKKKLNTWRRKIKNPTSSYKDHKKIHQLSCLLPRSISNSSYKVIFFSKNLKYIHFSNFLKLVSWFH